MSQLDQSKFQFVKRDDFAAEHIDTPSYSYWKSVSRQFWKKKSSVVMVTLLALILSMSFFYPLFSDYDYNDVSKINDFSARFVFPNSEYWFGTDKKGHSLFDALWFGAKNSILISFLATSINLILGVIVGGIWGVSKSFDRVMLEVYNIISNVPQFLILTVMAYALGTGFWNLIFAMTVTGWMGIAYSIRVQIMRYRDLEYNLASQTLGTPTTKVVFRNMLPQLISVLMTMIATMLPGYISSETFLSMFNLGLPVTVPSLGRLIKDYSVNITVNWYLFWIPLTVLVLVSFALYLVGQNLADASDPRSHR